MVEYIFDLNTQYEDTAMESLKKELSTYGTLYKNFSYLQWNPFKYNTYIITWSIIIGLMTYVSITTVPAEHELILPISLTLIALYIWLGVYSFSCVFSISHNINLDTDKLTVEIRENSSYTKFLRYPTQIHELSPCTIRAIHHIRRLHKNGLTNEQIEMNKRIQIMKELGIKQNTDSIGALSIPPDIKQKVHQFIESFDDKR